MGKREFDRQKHSTKAYDLAKSGKAGKGGWGDALADYEAEKEQYEEEYVEETQEVEETSQEVQAGSEESSRPVKRKAVIEWTSEEVSLWVGSIGASFDYAASQFSDAEIDGPTLFDLTLEDIQETLGKGLKTKKIWMEVQKLVEAALEAPPTNVRWCFYNQQWKCFTPKDTARIEQNYQKREEIKMGRWTLCLDKIKPFAKNGSMVRLLRRDGEFDRAHANAPKPQDIKMSKKGAWAKVAMGGNRI